MTDLGATTKALGDLIETATFAAGVLKSIESSGLISETRLAVGTLEARTRLEAGLARIEEIAASKPDPLY